MTISAQHSAPGLQRFLGPLVRFLHTEAAGGIVLLACTVTALVLANSPLAQRYHAFWHTHLTIRYGAIGLDRPLEWWVNDGLMTLFFFVVGLEIKRELVAGELRDPRKAALPAAAALGGMIAPALIYLSLQAGQPGQHGWGIPMATDIAFVVGVLALLGRRVPAGLKILLLALAIVDDLGAVLVIAVAYTDHTSMAALKLAGIGFVLVVVLRLARVRAIVVYLLVGLGIWLAVLHSGVHPTIAGVLLGLLTPSREYVGKRRLLAVMEAVCKRLRVDISKDELRGYGDEIQAVVEHAQNTLSPLDRLQIALHPWVAFVIMPLFALANAGVEVEASKVVHPVALAVALGLSLGKPLGIVLFSLTAVRLGLASLPTGVNARVLVGAGFLGGIGFTMSLFIASLGLRDDMLIAGKVGTLIGSLVSAAIGSAILLAVLPAPADEAGLES